MTFDSSGSFLFSASPDLLRSVLEVSLTGFILFRPLFAPTDPDTIIDLGYEYLNPAAQQMLRLPERPAETFLTLYPATTFLSGEPGRYDVNYQHDGLDNYFQLAARPCGELLLVSFSDTAEQPRTAVEQALRQSQAREREARAEAQRQRQELHELFEQAPVALAVLRGTQYVVEMANSELLRLWGRTREQALDKPLFEVLPEVAGQRFEELLAGVLASGEPYVAHEMPSIIERAGQ
jgi:PAS domain-containing protein